MNTPKTICLLGASFDTGNLGVNALAWSSLKLIMSRWPAAEVILLGVGRQAGQSVLLIQGKKVTVKTLPIRYCTNILAGNHIVELFFFVVLARLGLVQSGPCKSNTRDFVLTSDLFLDITGGDSFSDLYGMKRFIKGWLSKKLCQITGKPFIMLPQTYGPYLGKTAKLLAADILKHSTALYSRDSQGVQEIMTLIGENRQVEVVPDVAFVLDPVRPESKQTYSLEQLKSKGAKLIGLNISGLLYNEGYTGKNEFGLKCNYKNLLRNIIAYFVNENDVYVILIPHVIPDDCSVENDLAASRELWQMLSPEEQKKVFVLEDKYDQNQVKYLIGLCEFFMGARMHSAIAALSQGIPAVGMAYSKKFMGVFDIAGVAGCVVDLRQLDAKAILSYIQDIYSQKDEYCRKLQQSVPAIQKKVVNMLSEI